MDKIKPRPDAAVLQTMLLRSLQQAMYSPDNVGHFGLAYEAYTHFTSPIRRYPGFAGAPRHQGHPRAASTPRRKPGRRWAKTVR